MAREDGDRVVGLLRNEDYDEHADWLETQQILDEARGETRRFLLFAIIPILLIIVTAAVIFYAASRDDDSNATGPAIQSESTEDGATAQPDTADADAETAADDTAAAGEEAEEGRDAAVNTETDDEAEGPTTTTVSLLPPAPTDAPYVNATLTDNIFVLSGTVPSEAVKAQLEGQAEIAYAPFATSELEVDDSIDEAEWLAGAPAVVGLLPMITDGTIRLQDAEVTIIGRSPKEIYVQQFEGALGALTGLPVTNAGVEITNEDAPRFVTTVTDGQVLLEGEIPSEAIAETFIQGAAAVYGPENVTSTMTVVESTHSSFWMYTMPGVFQLFSPFPSYKIQVEDGVTSGSAQGGVLFDLNSAEITAETEQILGIAIALLTRDRSLELTVVGHTDSQGPAEINQELSLQRAQSVVSFMVAAGIDPDRITAEGKGSDEPIADNSTEEGRALNRRVEFLFN